jgi:hypothetical protein
MTAEPKPSQAAPVVRAPLYAPHRSIELLEEVAAEAGLPIGVVSYTERESARYLTLPGPVRNLADPWRLSATVRRRLESCRLLLLREFLTVPLLLGSPALVRFRRRLVLVAVHNIQRARLRARDRSAMRALSRLGFRFLALESSAGWREIGIDPAQGTVLDVPLVPTRDQLLAPRAAKRELVFGIVGRPREEKGSRGVIERLRAALAAAGLPDRILVGRPTASEPLAGEDESVEFVDTTTDDGYRRALERCAVVFIDYLRADYEYRTSGTILDAAAAAAVPVCPDFPVLRVQVATPSPIGVTFESEADLPRALAVAAKMVSQGVEPFEVYLRHRRGRGVIEVLQRLIGFENPSGPG